MYYIVGFALPQPSFYLVPVRFLRRTSAHYISSYLCSTLICSVHFSVLSLPCSPDPRVMCAQLWLRPELNRLNLLGACCNGRPNSHARHAATELFCLFLHPIVARDFVQEVHRAEFETRSMERAGCEDEKPERTPQKKARRPQEQARV
jgi:hypothetical protein